MKGALAVLNGDLQSLKFLMTLIRICDDDLVALAARKGYLDIVKYLIKEGFDVNVANTDGETPLHFASLYGDLAVFKVIWNESIEKNPKDKNGITPLHFACQHGHRLIVKFLISRDELNLYQKCTALLFQRGGWLTINLSGGIY